MIGNGIEKFRILLIDDDLLVSQVIFNILSNAGFKTILTATSGKDALDLLKKHRFNIVILDLALKDISGIVVLKSIKKYKESINKTSDVIILTGHPSVRTCRVSFKLGAFDFILKPWSNEKFLATLNAALVLSRSNQKISILESTNEALQQSSDQKFGPIIGESAAMRKVMKIIGKVST